MNGSSESQAGHARLILLNRIVAGLSIGTAVLLFMGAGGPGVPGPAAASRHDPVIVHCVLTALLLLIGNGQLKDLNRHGPSLPTVASAGMAVFPAAAVMELALAGRALFHTGSDASAALLLAVPGILFAWTFFEIGWTWRRNLQRAEEEEAKAKADSSFDDHRAGSDLPPRRRTGRQGSPPSISSQIPAAMVGTALFIAFCLTYTAGVAWFHMLETAIFERSFAGWPDFFRSVQAALADSVPTLMALTPLTFLTLAGGMTAQLLSKRRNRQRREDAGRALNEEERAFVEDAFRRLETFADEAIRKLFPYRVRIASLLCLLVALFASFILLPFGGDGLGSGIFEESRTEGLDWHLYIDDWGIGEILVFLSAMLLIYMLFALIGFRWPDYRNFHTLDIRRELKRGGPYWNYYRDRLVRDVRDGVLDTNGSFDPAAYVAADFRRFMRLLFIAAGLLVPVTLSALYLDRMDYDLLTEEYIETTDYWSSRVHRLGYGDVDRVEIACSKDDDGDLELSYLLKFADGRTIRAIDLNTPNECRNILPQRVEAWTKVDAKLRAAGVKVRHAMREAEGRSERQFDEAECRAGLDVLVGRGMREKIMPLLRESGRTSTVPS